MNGISVQSAMPSVRPLNPLVAVDSAIWSQRPHRLFQMPSAEERKVAMAVMALRVPPVMPSVKPRKPLAQPPVVVTVTAERKAETAMPEAPLKPRKTPLAQSLMPRKRPPEEAMAERKVAMAMVVIVAVVTAVTVAVTVATVVAVTVVTVAVTAVIVAVTAVTVAVMAVTVAVTAMAMVVIAVVTAAAIVVVADKCLAIISHGPSLPFWPGVEFLSLNSIQ